MSTKEIAEHDIKQELSKNGKCFLSFHTELNPIMRKLVRQHIKAQISLSPFSTTSHHNSQLVAHCFFCNGEVKYENYQNYYK